MVWRTIRRGKVRAIPGSDAVSYGPASTARRHRRREHIPPFSPDHVMFRLVGAGRGGGQAPGARLKHDVLDR